jgi:hypothetical protein
MEIDLRGFPVEVLMTALRQIPACNAAWPSDEFHNGELQPMYDISRETDWHRLAVVAVDLGAAQVYPTVREAES